MTTSALRRLAFVLLLAVAAAPPARADTCAIDMQGADDAPGQKDLNEFCLDGTCTGGFVVYWNFDDTAWSGSNTGDACALFDSDADGKANFAVCATLSDGSPPATAPSISATTCYSCDDSRPDRCPNAVSIPCASSCTVSLVSDPFAPHPSSKCHGTGCDTTDARATCCVTPADFNVAHPVLEDVCAFASSQPNSDADDCIIATACSSDSDCAENNPCSVDSCDTSNHICLHVPAAAGGVCRASAGDCDATDHCDGMSTVCADGVAPAGTVCRSSAGTCDPAEACDGTSAACPPDVTSGGVCRAAAGACDVAEYCDGTNPDCPPDAYRPSTAVCRSSAGVCDPPEQCTGTSADCPDDAKSTAVCRSATGDCDVAESCDGTNVDCPQDAFQAAGDECRGAAGPCDVAEQCTGTSADCPPDAKSTAVCRAAAGACDLPESCDGTSDDCPPDAVKAANVECRASAGVCDPAEACDGTSGTCPPDTKSTAVCRSSAGDCDPAESCDGTHPDCPADAFQPDSVVCRSAAGACDLVEHCTGTSAACPTDKKSTAVCRAAAGDCDVAESCDGTNDDCPPDGVKDGGTVCRSSAGACDPAEQCDGATAACPPDAKSTVVCRSAAGDCDVAERCDGTHDNCPMDAKSTAVCRAAAGACDLPESCDGAGNDCPANAFKPSSTVCRAAAGVCDVAENCTGSSAACPADAVKAQGVSCPADANPCTADACNGVDPTCHHPLGRCSILTNSSLCTFDVDAGMTGDQFRLIFTPDTSPAIYKLNASNPGQFYYNVVYIGAGNTTVTLTIPYPFVTQGAVPLHVYSDVMTAASGGFMCFEPGAEIANSNSQITLTSYATQQFGSTTTVSVTLPSLPGGVAFINLHLDYGLKGQASFSKDGNNNAIDATTKTIRLPDKQAYTFLDSTPGGDVTQSENVFKKDPGIAGLVLKSGTNDPVPNVAVRIYDASNKLVASLTTDQDGWYAWQYKYTGKATTFIVKLPDYGLMQTVTLKSNGFVTASFTVR